MNYEHRMMRCKLDRSAKIGKRRYRPGEILEEGQTPTEDFELVPGQVAPAPVAIEKPKKKKDEETWQL